MKLLIIFCSVLFLHLPVFSQSNQIKVYLQQIAANKVYLEYLQKGYKIARQGLTFIGNVKDGHFSLDKNFFLSLETINSKIRNYTRIAEVISSSLEISRDFTGVLKDMRESNLFAGSEVSYVADIRIRLLTSCENMLSDLVPLITSGKMELSDDERIKRIDAIYADMQDCYLFTKSFCSSTKVQVLQRQQEMRDVKTMRKVTE
ncbi:hypothetical protein [Chitinophaga sp. 212800010-3]|uniref:hypothetical protein n=1 Tax=unclassified Chitinophaga TaxID=2619133 RepID=UPI002DED18C5|nr:GldM-N domain-containing protein [Chitinophaga sp. 212800010-3]